MRALHGGMRAGAGTGMELCAMIGANENAQETVTANEIEVGIVIATATAGATATGTEAVTATEAGIVTVIVPEIAQETAPMPPRCPRVDQGRRVMFYLQENAATCFISDDPVQLPSSPHSTADCNLPRKACASQCRSIHNP